MRKILAGAIVAAVAMMAVAVASASAAPLVGTCYVEGNANFKKGGAPHALKFGVPANLEYEFTSSKLPEAGLPDPAGFRTKAVKGVECEEPGVPVKVWKGEAKVTPGKGELACGVATGLEVGAEEQLGEVDLTLSENGEAPWAKQYDLDLQLVAVGGTVVVTVGRSPEVEGKDTFVAEAAGEANFLAPGNAAAKTKRVEECEKSKLTVLPFYATLVGTLTEGS